MTATVEQARDALTLRQRAERAAKESEAHELRLAREREEQEDAQAARSILRELKSRGIPVVATEDDVLFDDPTPYGPWRGAYLAAGEGDDIIVFGVVSYYGDYELAVARPCARCGRDVFVFVRGLAHLHEILTRTDHDHGNCLVQYDEDGNPITDRDGKPLPPAAPKPISLQVETVEDRLAKSLRELVRDELRELRIGVSE